MVCVIWWRRSQREGCATPHTPPKYPDASSATSAGGTFVNIADLRNVHQGLNKDQMYDLPGPPHFDEWFVGNQAWNYQGAGTTR
jgi:outer membrane protein assembly factor BamE (lipoprotein component of BamABCDE complex)